MCWRGAEVLSGWVTRFCGQAAGRLRNLSLHTQREMRIHEHNYHRLFTLEHKLNTID